MTLPHTQRKLNSTLAKLSLDISGVDQVSNKSLVYLPPLTMSTRRTSGYQLFFQDKLVDVQNNNSVAPKDRVSHIAAMWRTLPDLEKQFWVEAAGKRKLNGYQRYVKEQMPIVKNNNSVAPKDRLAYIAQMWQQLSPVQKAEWKD